MRTRSDILAAVAAERERQVSAEGYAPEHDDKRVDGEIADAAAHYAATMNPYFCVTSKGCYVFEAAWPWATHEDKKHSHDRKRQLEIAAALIVAELERLERAGE